MLFCTFEDGPHPKHIKSFSFFFDEMLPNVVSHNFENLFHYVCNHISIPIPFSDFSISGISYLIYYTQYIQLIFFYYFKY